jgi:hypothetical protein
LGSTPAAAFAVPDLIRGRARRLQLTGGERLLGGVQERVHMLPRRAHELLRDLDLRQPALLDDDELTPRSAASAPGF